ncbi:MAG: hypothetical protein SGARI_005572 [Bacillariaceae sp.]
MSEMRFLEKLYLNGNGYEGDLPGNLYQMKALTHLELADNAFTGPMRTLFPSNINNGGEGFQYLETLILSNNDLNGDIPETSFRGMSNLKTLSISGNPNPTGSLNEKPIVRMLLVDVVNLVPDARRVDEWIGLEGMAGLGTEAINLT